MLRNRIFGTYTFRFMISYVTALSVVVFILLGITYTFYSYEYFTGVNDQLENELDILQHEYREQGLTGMETLTAERRKKSKFDRFSYILVDGQQQKLSGDLSHWPEYKEWSDGWLSFEMSFSDWQGQPQLYNFLARSRLLEDGNQLLVARVSDDVRQNIKLVVGTMTWGLIIMIILGLIGAIITSYMTFSRVETINTAIRTIMSGDLSERIPIEEPIDDFQHLARNINNMLERIENSMNDVRQVADNIAHDLRTPLTRLRNKLSTLETRSAPHNRDMVLDMLGEADHLLSTFSALLRIAQVESGAKKANFQRLSLTQIFTDVVELYEPVASVKDIELTVGHCDDVAIRGDKDLLFQMLVNLMDNAIKYTPDGGRIRVSLEEEGDNIYILFADSGPGIPPDKYAKVFQRFYRVESSRSEHPGNGLGLSLVQAVATLHGGAVSLSSSQQIFVGNETSGLQVCITINQA